MSGCSYPGWELLVDLVCGTSSKKLGSAGISWDERGSTLDLKDAIQDDGWGPRKERGEASEGLLSIALNASRSGAPRLT